MTLYIRDLIKDLIIIEKLHGNVEVVVEDEYVLSYVTPIEYKGEILANISKEHYHSSPGTSTMGGSTEIRKRD